MSANQTDPQFKLRVPPELKVKIEESAKAHNRSMNADMVLRLEQSFEDEARKRGELQSLLSMQHDVTFGTYNITDNVSPEKAHEMAARLLSDFLRRRPECRLINVESLERGIRFWYSYPVGGDAAKS